MAIRKNNVQVIVQRSLAAKNLDHGRAGNVLASLFKVLAVFIFLIPGMAARLLFPEYLFCDSSRDCLELCGNEQGCSNLAYPVVVTRLMPNMLRGLMIAVVLSGCVSSLTSMFNSAATIFAVDFYSEIRRNRAGSLEIVFASRIFVCVLIAVAVAWVPIIHSSIGHQMAFYCQTLVAYTAAPLATAFAMGIFIPKINEHGCFWGLMAGFIVGLVRIVGEFFLFPPETRCDAVGEWKPVWVTAHYHYVGLVQVLATFSLALVVSLMTKSIPEDSVS